MTEQDRAAALANDIERLGFTAGEGMSFIPTQLFVEVKKLLRRFGATTAMPETPTAPSVVTDDMLDALISALDVRAGYSRDHFATLYSESEKVSARDWYRPALEAALKVKEAPAASSEVRERVARAMAIADGSKDPDALFAPPQTMNSPRDPYPVWMEWLGQADASLSAISPGDEIGDCVLAPKEPSDAQIAAMDQILDEMRETDDGWPVSDVVTLYKAALAAAKETTR